MFSIFKKCLLFMKRRLIRSQTPRHACICFSSLALWKAWGLTTQLPVKSREVISKTTYIQIHSAQRHSTEARQESEQHVEVWLFVDMQLGSERLDWKECSSLLPVPFGEGRPHRHILALVILPTLFSSYWGVMKRPCQGSCLHSSNSSIEIINFFSFMQNMMAP